MALRFVCKPKNHQPGLVAAQENGRCQVAFRPEDQLLCILHDPEPRLLPGLEEIPETALQPHPQDTAHGAKALRAAAHALEARCRRASPETAHGTAFQALRELAAIEAQRQHPDEPDHARSAYARKIESLGQGAPEKRCPEARELGLEFFEAGELPLRPPELQPDSGLRWQEPFLHRVRKRTEKAAFLPEQSAMALTGEILWEVHRLAELFAERSLGHSIPAEGRLHPPCMALALSLRLGEISRAARPSARAARARRAAPPA